MINIINVIITITFTIINNIAIIISKLTDNTNCPIKKIIRPKLVLSTSALPLGLACSWYNGICYNTGTLRRDNS